MILPLIMILVVAILAIFFTNANQTVIQVIVFGHTIKSATGLLLVGALGIGIVLGLLSMLPSVLKRSLDVLRHKEELAQMKQKEAAKKP